MNATEAPAPETPVAATPQAPPTPEARRAAASAIARKFLGLDPPEKASTEPEKASTEPAEKASTEPAEKASTEPAEKEPTEKEPTGKAFKKLRLERQAIAEQRKAYEAERAAYEAERAAYKAEREADERLKAEDPYAWVRKQGLTMKDLAARAVRTESEDPKEKEIRELRAKIEEIEKRGTQTAEQIKAEQEAARVREAQESARNVRAICGQAFAETSPEDFPYLRTYDADQIAAVVAEEMIEHFRTTQQAIEPRDVFAALERRLREEAEDRAARLAKIAPKPAEPPAEKTPARQPVAGDVSSREIATRTVPDGPLTPEQRRMNAMAKAREMLGRKIGRG